MSRSFLLQDWTTIRSSLGSGVPLIQDPDGWLDLDGYSDVTCWIHIAEVTPPTSSCVNLQLQTAPSADDAYFVALAPQLSIGGTGFTPASATPLIVRSAKTTVSNNLMRYLRWNITPAGSGTWDLTFRIHAIAARSTTFVPPLIPGCVAWYRADLGVAVNSGTSNVTGWNDQSGTNDANKNLATASGTQPTINLADANYNGQPTINFVKLSSTYMKCGTWTTAVSQPNTWIVVGHTSASGSDAAMDGNDPAGGQNVGRGSGTIWISATTGLQWSNSWGSPAATFAEFNDIGVNHHSKIYFNDFTNAKTTGVTGSVGQTSLTVASSNAALGPNYFWDGPIAEIIGYSGLLSSTSKAQLRSYLRGRYGIAIG